MKKTDKRMQPPANTNEADANEISDDEQGNRYRLAQAEELFIRFMEANGRPVRDEQELIDWCSSSDHERPIRPHPSLLR